MGLRLRELDLVANSLKTPQIPGRQDALLNQLPNSFFMLAEVPTLGVLGLRAHVTVVYFLKGGVVRWKDVAMKQKD